MYYIPPRTILVRQYYDYRLLDLHRLSFSVRIISRVWHLSDPFNGLSSIRRVMLHVEYFFPFSPFSARLGKGDTIDTNVVLVYVISSREREGGGG